MKLVHLTENESAIDFSDVVSDLPEKYQSSLLKIGSQLFKLGYSFNGEDAFTDHNEKYFVYFEIRPSGEHIDLRVDIGSGLVLKYEIRTAGLAKIESEAFEKMLRDMADGLTHLSAVHDKLPSGSIFGLHQE